MGAALLHKTASFTAASLMPASHTLRVSGHRQLGGHV